MKCLDTYALVEIDKQNPRFAEYTRTDFVITGETLAEFVWVLLRDVGTEAADYWQRKLLPFAVAVTPETLAAAMRFRREHKKRRISFFDAVGYVYALELLSNVVDEEPNHAAASSASFLIPSLNSTP